MTARQPAAKILRTEVLPIPNRRAISEALNRSALRRRTSSAFSEAVRGLPCDRPSLRAWAIPALTRSRKISRSNSAKIASIPGHRPSRGRRQVEGLGQRDEARRRDPVNSRSVVIRSATDRPQRSRRQTTMTSISRRRAAIRSDSRLGRSFDPSRCPRPLRDNPATILDVSRHRLDLHPQGLLVVRGNPSINRDAHGPALPGQKPPPNRAAVKPLVSPRLDGPPSGVAVIYPFRPPGSGHSAGFHRSGNNSSIRLLGCVLTRSSTSRR